jgi:hypothetical protein
VIGAILKDFSEHGMLGGEVVTQHNVVICLPLEELSPRAASAYYDFAGQAFQAVAGYPLRHGSYVAVLKEEDDVLRGSGHTILVTLVHAKGTGALYYTSRLVIGRCPPLLEQLGKLNDFGMVARVGLAPFPPFELLRLVPKHQQAVPGPTIMEWLGVRGEVVCAELTKAASIEHSTTAAPLPPHAALEAGDWQVRQLARTAKHCKVVIGSSPAHFRMVQRTCHKATAYGAKSKLMSVLGIGDALLASDPHDPWLAYHQLADKTEGRFPAGLPLASMGW